MDIQKILKDHKAWLDGSGGTRANLIKIAYQINRTKSEGLAN